TDPKINYFHVHFLARVYRCQAGASKQRLAESTLLNAQLPQLSKLLAGNLPRDLRFKFVVPAQQYDPDYHGPRETKLAHYKKLSLLSGDAKDETLVFTTKGGKPKFAQVALQVAREVSPPPQGNPCAGWDMPARLIQQQMLTPSFAPGNTSPGEAAQMDGTLTVNDSQLVKGLASDKSGRAY